jgi:triosephosphate isomerase
VTDDITPLIAGNWKMNGTTAALGEVRRLAERLGADGGPRCTVLICPPATLLSQLTAIAATGGIVTGGQDCHPAPSGPYTGDVSAPMLADAGAQYVILGHSERRAAHGETDAVVRNKALAALAAGLIPIVCVGEEEVERREGRAMTVVRAQLEGSVPDEGGARSLVIAYEPIWAIGTGVTPTSEEIAEMHAGIRELLEQRFGERGARVCILYGGSMKPGNARDILMLDNVNGGLVGGASLLADDFHAIISAV